MAILDDARSAMEIVGKRFEQSGYFIPDLMMAGEILAGVSKIVKPHISQEQGGGKLGRVLIGTVAGDIHDIVERRNSAAATTGRNCRICASPAP